MKNARIGNTYVKLQSRVTSSGTLVVSLIFFLYRGLGVDGMAEFFERAGGGRGCCMEHFIFLDNLGYLYLCWSECWGLGVGKCW